MSTDAETKATDDEDNLALFRLLAGDDSAFNDVATHNVALELNDAYREVLVDTLDSINRALSQIAKRKEECKRAVEKDPKHREIKAQPINTPYFRIPSKGACRADKPPENQDVKMLRECGDPVALSNNTRWWNTADAKRLRECVEAEALRTLSQPLVNKKEIFNEKLLQTTVESKREEMAAEISRLDKAMNKLTLLPKDKMLDMVDINKLDWLRISLKVWSGERSAESCRVMWINALHPNINRARWSDTEDKRLNEIVRRHNQRHWTDIAKELGTNRTPFQCLQRYQQKLNKPFLQTKFTPPEDELLRQLVKICAVGDNIAWSEVAYYMDGRSGSQCCRRWATLRASEDGGGAVPKGQWSQYEIDALIRAHEKYGSTWGKVSQAVGSRSSVQCRDFYTRHLDKSLSFAEFTYAEDKRMIQLYEKFPGRWAVIAYNMPGRCDYMVRTRMSLLLRWTERLKELQDPMLIKLFRCNARIELSRLHRNTLMRIAKLDESFTNRKRRRVVFNRDNVPVFDTPEDEAAVAAEFETKRKKLLEYADDLMTQYHDIRNGVDLFRPLSRHHQFQACFNATQALREGIVREAVKKELGPTAAVLDATPTQVDVKSGLPHPDQMINAMLTEEDPAKLLELAHAVNYAFAVILPEEFEPLDNCFADDSAQPPRARRPQRAAAAKRKPIVDDAIDDEGMELDNEVEARPLSPPPKKARGRKPGQKNKQLSTIEYQSAPKQAATSTSPPSKTGNALLTPSFQNSTPQMFLRGMLQPPTMQLPHQANVPLQHMPATPPLVATPRQPMEIPPVPQSPVTKITQPLDRTGARNKRNSSKNSTDKTLAAASTAQAVDEKEQVRAATLRRRSGGGDKVSPSKKPKDMTAEEISETVQRINDGRKKSTRRRVTQTVAEMIAKK